MATTEEQSTPPASAVRHRETIDWSRREPVSSAVLTSVQSVDGRSPQELDPLAHYVDPDALEALFAGSDGESTSRHFSFEYDEYIVHVDGAGHVSIC
ncbi:HalOD1 output domain-containing protein [Haloplanus salilacus]|uniref:HalOD1 output domain-containing protein n=1 Tax=Haloplanus salilacus TaxID=2949994 RepID=UPI0030CC82F5